MPYINAPYINGFQFVAGQIGASEFQIAEVTGNRPSVIREDNRDIGSLLAFPYHDRRGGRSPTQQQLMDLWNRWREANADITAVPRLSLVAFRALIDPWLAVDMGLSDPNPARPGAMHSEPQESYAPGRTSTDSTGTTNPRSTPPAESP